MYLNKIELKNFRCYQENTFLLGKKISIFIGKNGTGKSSLLSAFRKGLTFVFSNTGNNKFIKNNPNKVEGFSSWDTTFNDINGFQWPTDIQYEIFIGDECISWKFHKNKYGGKLHQSLYKNAQNKVLNRFREANRVLPLLAFYGDKYPHQRKDNNANINNFNRILTKSNSLPKDLGYAFWNLEGSIVSSWFIRTKHILNEIQQIDDDIKNIESEIKYLEGGIKTTELDALKERLNLLKEEKIPYQEEYDFVRNKLKSFFSQINEFDNEDLVFYGMRKRKVEKDDYLSFDFRAGDNKGGFFNEESLPMGYQRLLHIAYDMAYRSYVLNGNREPNGIVLIDEIELHLHPSLQKTVLQRFRKTFPDIQFIITTHSPIVLSSFNANDKNAEKIIELEKNNGEYNSKELDNLYSIDYNSNLVDVMGVNTTDDEVNAYISAYNFLKNRKEDNRIIEEYYAKISKIYNDNIPSHIKQKLKE